MKSSSLDHNEIISYYKVENDLPDGHHESENGHCLIKMVHIT